MKKILFFLAALVFLVSCKKDTAAVSSGAADKINLDNAVVVSKGALVFNAGTNETGLAKVYRQTDGRYVLGLEEMEYKTVFDLAIYLSTTPLYSTGSLKLYSAKNFDNNIYYKLPAGVKGEDFKFVIMKKLALAPNEATAELQ